MVCQMKCIYNIVENPEYILKRNYLHSYQRYYRDGFKIISIHVNGITVTECICNIVENSEVRTHLEKKLLHFPLVYCAYFYLLSYGLIEKFIYLVCMRIYA